MYNIHRSCHTRKWGRERLPPPTRWPREGVDPPPLNSGNFLLRGRAKPHQSKYQF